jgi:retron-type reverse transcriptase
MLTTNDVDVLCVTETWLRPSMDSNFIQIEGYNVFRKDRERKGGGACIYVKNEYETRKMNSFGEGDEVDDVWITVQVRKTKSFIVGAIYRPPKANSLSFKHLESIIQTAANLKKNIYVLGDLNDDQLKPNKLGPIIKKLKLEQLIETPTRITKDGGRSLLDLIITNNRTSVLRTSVSPSVADHEEISCTITVHKEKSKPSIQTFRSQEGYSKDALKLELHNRIPLFNNMRHTDDVNVQSTIFQNTFLEALDSVAPTVTKKLTRPPKRWITPELKREMDHLNKMRAALQIDTGDNSTKKAVPAEQSPESCSSSRKEFESQRTHVRKLIRNAKKSTHLAELQNAKNNPKQTWNILGNIVPHKKPKKAISYENSGETAETFNDFFANVGKRTHDEVMGERNEGPSCIKEIGERKESTSKPSTETWSPKPASREEIISAIYSLKNTNSYGCDGIQLKYLKDGLGIILPYLQLLINTSIATNTFPQNLKHALIKAIHKQGEKENPSNYRPISLLPVTSKILEKIISRQLLEYLEDNNLINANQYAYRRKTSTEDALIKISELVYKAIDQNCLSLLVLLDLSKAFDSVNHDTLMEKLRQLNIETPWFESYLKDRSQSVMINRDVISQPRPVNFGVPQGSILGPVLFLLFVNDISCGSPADNAKMTLYADDVQLLFIRPTNELSNLKEDAETALTHIHSWYTSNGLKINAEKNQCIILGSKANTSKVPDNFAVDFRGEKISPANYVKSLGVFLDPNMTFKHHTEKLCSRLNGTLMFLNRTKQQLDFESRLLVINALIFSHLNYCPTIWGKCNTTRLDDIQRCLNFAAKVAHEGNFTKSDHVTPLLNKLGWLNIRERLELHDATRVYKIQNKTSCPNGIVLSSRGATHNRTTRNSSDIDTEIRRTQTSAKAFSVSGPKVFNKLPAEVKNSTNASSFRKECTKLLLARRQRAAV